MLVKAFKLREGAAHTHDGQAVLPGDTVHLTKTQARAFRDKFEPVDDGDFNEVKEVPVYEPKGDKKQDKKGAVSASKDTKDAPQGQPVVTPVIPLRPAAPAAGPTDVHAIDPANQGQQSREVRAIIDAGDAPVAKAFGSGEVTTKRTPVTGPAIGHEKAPVAVEQK
jgi:hypothetical protein